ncbi:MAG: hypothetical protein HQK49_19695 [Oligoflexia bacterium]|nr:hypothetical protein [Oligoflexia bacterium]
MSDINNFELEQACRHNMKKLVRRQGLIIESLNRNKIGNYEEIKERTADFDETLKEIIAEWDKYKQLLLAE